MLTGASITSMGFEILTGATGNHVSLLPDIREIIPVGRWQLVSKFLRNVGFPLTTRNSVVQTEFNGLPAFWSFGNWSLIWP